MNKLMSLCYFVLSLFGLDVGGETFVHRVSADGGEVLHSRTHVQAGVAYFECMRSVSGQCHYTVYPRDCSPAMVTARAAGCGAASVRRFAIPGGGSRQLSGLHDIRLCVSADGSAPGPDCGAVEAVAAR